MVIETEDHKIKHYQIITGWAITCKLVLRKAQDRLRKSTYLVAVKVGYVFQIFFTSKFRQTEFTMCKDIMITFWELSAGKMKLLCKYTGNLAKETEPEDECEIHLARHPSCLFVHLQFNYWDVSDGENLWTKKDIEFKPLQSFIA